METPPARIPAVSRRTLVLIALAALLPYLPSLPFEPAYDDVARIVNDPRLETLDGLGDLLLGNYFAFDEGHMYRPLTSVSYWISEQLGGGAPWGHRVFNLLLHVAVTLLILPFVRLLGLRPRAAIIAALFFAWTPAHPEGVVQLVGRGELLMAALAIATFLHLRGPGYRPVWSLRLQGGVLFFLTLAAKENGILLLLWLAAWDGFWGRRRTPRELIACWWSHRADYAVLVAGVALYLALRALALPQFLPQLHERFEFYLIQYPLFPDRLLSGGTIWLHYIWKTLFPTRISYTYDIDKIELVHSWISVWGWLGVACWLTWVGAALRGMRSRAPWAAGMLVFAVFLLLHMQWAIALQTIFAMRSLYLPVAGIGIVLAWMLDQVWRERPAIGSRLAAVLLLAQLVMLPSSIVIWRDEPTLYHAGIERTPESYHAWQNMAGLLYNEPEYEEAWAAAQRSLAIVRHPDVLQTAGKILAETGRGREAIPYFREARLLLPYDPTPYFWEGQLLLMAGEREKALDLLRQGAALEAPGGRIATWMAANGLSP